MIRFLFILVMVALSLTRWASAGTVVKPFTFSPNTKALSSQVNSDFDTLYALINGNLDSGNVGPAGILASQIKPTTVGSATFGGSYAYTFPLGLTVSGTLTAAALNVTGSTTFSTLTNFSNGIGVSAGGASITGGLTVSGAANISAIATASQFNGSGAGLTSIPGAQINASTIGQAQVINGYLDNGSTQTFNGPKTFNGSIAVPALTATSLAVSGGNITSTGTVTGTTALFTGPSSIAQIDTPGSGVVINGVACSLLRIAQNGVASRACFDTSGNLGLGSSLYASGQVITNGGVNINGVGQIFNNGTQLAITGGSGGMYFANNANTVAQTTFPDAGGITLNRGSFTGSGSGLTSVPASSLTGTTAVANGGTGSSAPTGVAAGGGISVSGVFPFQTVTNTAQAPAATVVSSQANGEKTFRGALVVTGGSAGTPVTTAPFTSSSSYTCVITPGAIGPQTDNAVLNQTSGSNFTVYSSNTTTINYICLGT